MFGLTRGTTKEHFIRAVLESLAYQTRDVLSAMQADAGLVLKALRVDGGAIANDFTAQFQADLLDVAVERPAVMETTALGAALLAGLAVGLYASKEEAAQMVKPDLTFSPSMSEYDRGLAMYGWHRAVERAKGWVEA